MKKVLFLAAAVALIATPALAGISNTKHNLRSSGTSTFKGTSDELCVYCHTPHGGTGGNAPLWNRTNTVAITNFYDRFSIESAVSALQTANSDAPLCLSCHDGASLTGNLNNPPNSGGGNGSTNISSNGIYYTNLGTDMTNDHPVGFVFDSTVDTELQDPTFASVSVAFGGNSDEMWCSSCHDVHKEADAFLVTSNAGSALCLQCHNK